MHLFSEVPLIKIEYVTKTKNKNREPCSGHTGHNAARRGRDVSWGLGSPPDSGEVGLRATGAQGLDLCTLMTVTLERGPSGNSCDQTKLSP